MRTGRAALTAKDEALTSSVAKSRTGFERRTDRPFHSSKVRDTTLNEPHQIHLRRRASFSMRSVHADSSPPNRKVVLSDAGNLRQWGVGCSDARERRRYRERSRHSVRGCPEALPSHGRLTLQVVEKRLCRKLSAAPRARNQALDAVCKTIRAAGSARFASGKF